MTRKINLEVYHGKEASVNAYIFSDDQSVILVDCLRNSTEAKLLAAVVKAYNKPLIRILITHGHPDHYIGLHVMKQEFPETPVVVTKQEIKDDIVTFSSWMDSVGWLDKEQAMRPKSTENPAGFDYEGCIDVLHSDKLKLSQGAILELNSNYDAAECEHLTTMYSKDLNAFFTGDFCYNHVHIWLAVDKKNIEYWKKQLDIFTRELSDINPKLYPGHGGQADLSLFKNVKSYIEDFEKTVSIAKSRADAMKMMEDLYPDYEQADFLLLNSVNASISA